MKTYQYLAFGMEKSIDPGDANPFRYCGEYYDKETKNIYLRARYYQPTQGRFMNEDPIKDGINWYVYCGNNPVNMVDTSGLNHKDVEETDEDGYTRTVDVRFDLKELLRMFGGVYKVDDENKTVSIAVLGKKYTITNYNEQPGYVDGHLHYTVGEFLNMIGISYTEDDVDVTVTKIDEKVSTLTDNISKKQLI